MFADGNGDGAVIMTDRHINTAPYYEEDEHHHYGFVIVAVVLSVVIHFAALKRAQDMRFDVTANLDPALREQREIKPPAHIENLAEDPLSPVENPFAGNPSETPSVGIQGEVAELASKPDTALSAPRVSEEALGVAKDVPVEIPEPQPVTDGWQPRQQVIEVVDRLVRDDVVPMPRLEVPSIERISTAPDYIPPVTITKDLLKTPPMPSTPIPLPNPGATPAPAAITPEKIEVPETTTPEAQTPEATISRFGEKPSDISTFKPVDSRLMAKAKVFRPNGETGRSYFRLEIAARDPSVLPVVPKDIVFVQDASRSLAEERLHFCRDALNQSIRFLPATDRFNVVLFREDAEFCFEGWASPTEENLAKAKSFIDAMKPRGDTDVFKSMQSILSLPRDPARPLIIVLVTDGKATKGLTESSRIIGEFSKLNDNVSVFALGTHGRANNYLLDMLSFCNRGTARVVTSGRWDIPKNISAVIEGCSQPVLGRVGVTTDLMSHADLYPLPSANLYANRTLEYYGSCPGDVTNLVVQVRGEGGKSKCDIIFQMDLSHAESGGDEIRENWVRRRMYSLIGEYARNPSPAILDAMQRLSLETGMPIPYRQQFIR